MQDKILDHKTTNFGPSRVPLMHNHSTTAHPKYSSIIGYDRPLLSENLLRKRCDATLHWGVYKLADRKVNLNYY